MKIVGLITEYNPFHNGHLYHIEKAKEITGADSVIVFMSGNYVQRGAPAIMPKHLRAEIALEAGADDVQISEDVCEIYTNPADFSAVNQAIENNPNLVVLEASISMIPQNTVTPDEATATKVRRLIDMLEDNDDVQNVYHNAELDEEEE